MSNHDESNIIEGTLSQTNSAKQIPQDLMLLKMENETIMSAAAVRPRKQSVMLAQLKDCIDSFPESADEAIYAKPVGKEELGLCSNCNKETAIAYGQSFKCGSCGSAKHKGTRKAQKYVEGLSIRAAESIRSIYGYNRLAMQQEMMPDGTAKITGTFVDYATGTMTSDTRIVHPFYTDSYKNVKNLTTERFDLAIKSEKAKLARDIILDSVPNNIKAYFRDICEKKIAETLTPEKVESEILPHFASYGITLVDLEGHIGRPISMGWTERDRGQLRKLLTALRSGEITVASLRADGGSGASDGDGNANKKTQVSPVNEKIGKGKQPKQLDYQQLVDAISGLSSVDANALIKAQGEGKYTADEYKTLDGIVLDKESKEGKLS